MASEQHTSLTLRAQLQGVNATLASRSSEDPGLVAQLPAQLTALRGHLEHEKLSEWSPVCTVAIRLAEALSEGRQVTPDDLFRLIDSIVADISKALGIERLDYEPPLPAIGAPIAKLKLLSARRLGEIMVQMSMLTPEQVERALQYQRSQGCRFGEALVEIGALSKDAVQSALRLQDKRAADAQRRGWSNGA